ncbi:HTH-type transcriptional activator CmpR [Oxobacter pfennigii]|uniref:HTH-type transcriptional activator CmpR n=1 Tax=Oxobacter pfennigii TaxID=36849 RepID=A0A0N8NTN3_9CLOT|nr:LysR family transcriptional regulator [Oxobacter pfennigii]KPU45312.1 HTH-type transcriptional activator CmpR [Oxobacter pfennigii]
MQIESLKFFYEVASAKSISKAAKSSMISQSALSQQIQRLEDSLGIKLLERSNRGVELTEAGLLVEKYAKNILLTYENMVESLADISKSNNTIKIDSVWTIATYALPCALYKLKKKFPGYSYNSMTNFSDDVEQNVINEICDVGFIYDKPHDINLTSSRVASDRFVAVAAENFSIKHTVCLKDLKDYGLIMLNSKSRERKSLNQHFLELGHDLNNFNILFELDSIESIKSVVVKGYGISFLPYLSIKKELYTKQLKEIQVSDFNMSFDIYMLYKKDKYMKKSIKDFIQYIKKIGEESFC